MTRFVEVRRLGAVPYAEGLERQRALVEQRQRGRVDDVLLLVEHPHVLTLGVRGDGGRGHILASTDQLAARGLEIHEAGRGGDITYHGPGQIVGYPILDLKPDRCDVHRYVRDLEEVLIRTAAHYGIAAERVPGLTGAWVGHEKLAAIGVRIARWVTSHGFALNITTDLDYFNLIVPCGVTGRGVTSLARLLGRAVDRREVEDCVVSHFCEVFERVPMADKESPVTAFTIKHGTAGLPDAGDRGASRGHVSRSKIDT
jgi:lipoyl(octanoyl) transferase